MKRYVTAIDQTGVYFRETLNVTHDAIRGEVVYHTKPARVSLSRDSKSARSLFKNLKKDDLINIATSYREGYFRVLKELQKERRKKIDA